jgi:hypothetical protein
VPARGRRYGQIKCMTCKRGQLDIYVLAASDSLSEVPVLWYHPVEHTHAGSWPSSCRTSRALVGPSGGGATRGLARLRHLARNMLYQQTHMESAKDTHCLPSTAKTLTLHPKLPSHSPLLRLKAEVSCSLQHAPGSSYLGSLQHLHRLTLLLDKLCQTSSSGISGGDGGTCRLAKVVLCMLQPYSQTPKVRRIGRPQARAACASIRMA